MNEPTRGEPAKQQAADPPAPPRRAVATTRSWRCAPPSTAVDRELLARLNERARLVEQVGERKRATGRAGLPGGARARPRRGARGREPGPVPDAGDPRGLPRDHLGDPLARGDGRASPTSGPRAPSRTSRRARPSAARPSFLPQATIARRLRGGRARRQADHGVVPVENTTEGVVTQTLDTLVESELPICGEAVLPISLCLLSRSGRLEDVRRVASHPQPLAQCRAWLDRNLPARRAHRDGEHGRRGASSRRARPTSRPSGAGSPPSSSASRRRGRAIQDRRDNSTRFLVLGGEPRPRRAATTSPRVVFTVRKAEAGRAPPAARALRAPRREPDEHPVAPAEGHALGVPVLHRRRGPPERARGRGGARRRRRRSRTRRACSAPSRARPRRGAARRAREPRDRVKPLHRASSSPTSRASRSRRSSASSASRDSIKLALEREPARALAEGGRGDAARAAPACTATRTARASALRAKLAERFAVDAGAARLRLRRGRAPRARREGLPAARATRSSSPGPRSRCTRSWRRAWAPTSVRVPLDADLVHDLPAHARARSRRGRASSSSATRTTRPARASARAAFDAFVAALPAGRGARRRRGLPRVRGARRTSRTRSPGSPGGPGPPCSAPSRSSTGSPALRVGYGWPTASWRAISSARAIRST